MRSDSAITTILFDLDDTLFDHVGTALAASRPALQQVSVEALCGHYS